MILMKNIRESEPVTPEQYALSKAARVRFFFDDMGREWHESQKLFSKDTIKVAFDEHGVIHCIQYDVSLIYPENMSVAEVEDSTANRRADISGEWLYVDGMIVKRKMSQEELVAIAENKRSQLLTEAEEVIAPLARAVKYSMASDEDVRNLELWEQYSVRVSRVSPLNPVWPERPL